MRRTILAAIALVMLLVIGTSCRNPVDFAQGITLGTEIGHTGSFVR